MKNSTVNFIGAFLVILKLSVRGFSQSKSEISLGLAFPEMSNIKFKHGTNFQLGAGLGYIPVIKFLTITGNIYYHFPAKAKNTNPNTWYLNLGLTFLNIFQNWEDERELFVYSRIGRRFKFKNGSGINLDLGLGLPIAGNGSTSVPLAGTGGSSLPEGFSKPLIVGSISYFITF
jgi:hypothetical protein